MDYTLMHKDVEVVNIEIHDVIGGITRIGDVDAVKHIPVGVTTGNNEINHELLNKWWTGRSIPASRQGIRGVLEKLKISSTKMLIDKCMGLSLSDQYWIRPVNSDLAWGKVNFFENSFSEDMGNVLFGRGGDGKISLLSPNNTSDGWLRKKWIIADDKRYLVKGASEPFRQEPLNEVFATEVMCRLDIPHVSYAVKKEERQDEKGKLYSICEDFITPQTELVSAWNIMLTQDYCDDESDYQHFLRCCDTLGILNAKSAMDQIFSVDFLIANTDRHLSNFGAVRNADTLEWLGIAPIYDNGTSMWHNALSIPVGKINIVESEPFCHSHAEQIKLASSLDFVNFEKLSDIEYVVDEIYKQSPSIDSNRRKRLCRAVSNHVLLLKKERDSRVFIKPRHQQQKNVVDDVANLHIEENHVEKAMDLLKEVPEDVRDEVFDALKTFGKIHLTFENGKYNVLTEATTKTKYARDYEFLGIIKAEDVYTKDERDNHQTYEGQRKREFMGR
ncbi:hypothetical protein FACS1894187_22160 [Synergistales bacterium]|nr:hypothetical protein FACS1894187_22160 [Synergistales bacterium]